ncbi:MAG: preprotein translocase subunit SecY, partial [Lachnospiraceae bacterium]|nr:preprotein translocase subunit SecY [Lachnospiraceae bacterium]
MFKTLRNAFKVKDVRKKLIFTLLMLFVVRLGCQIPVPETDASVLQEFLGKNDTVKGILGMMSGGSLENFAIFALGIGPYITASIIIQLLTAAFPALEEMQKEGEEGRKKLQSLTRYMTIALSALQGAFLAVSFGRMGVFGSSWTMGSKVWLVISTTIILTAGSACLMWIGERITERGVGNGISIVLTINILARIPSDFSALGQHFVAGKKILPAALAILIIAAIIVAMVVFVIYLQDGVRKIPVQYSKKVQGNKLVGGQQSHIPLRVNTAGVIPVIFASTLLSLPQIIQSYGNFNNSVWQAIVNMLTQSNWFRFTGGAYKWYYVFGPILY